MSAGHPARPFDTIAQKWCELAQRRHAYYVELFESGRWKHYFDEREFIARLRDVISSTIKWHELAGRPPPQFTGQMMGQVMGQVVHLARPPSAP